MTTILEEIIGSEIEEVPRYFKIIDENIQSGKLRKYSIYEKTKKKVLEPSSEDEDEDYTFTKSEQDELNDDGLKIMGCEAKRQILDEYW